MNTEPLKKALYFVKDQSTIYPGRYTALIFFLWGISIWAFSINLGKPFLAFLYFVLTHALTTAIVYVGFMKDGEGKRAALHITTSLAILLSTLVIDALFIVIF
jgi:hypothetical protein